MRAYILCTYGSHFYKRHCCSLSVFQGRFLLLVPLKFQFRYIVMNGMHSLFSGDFN